MDSWRQFYEMLVCLHTEKINNTQSVYISALEKVAFCVIGFLGY